MSTTTEGTTPDRSKRSAAATADAPGRKIPLALPEPGMSMDQDREWCVVQLGGEWKRIRFHDYPTIYDVPGLYERLFYDVLKCSSPVTIRRLMGSYLDSIGRSPSELRVLDLGAGNGMVGEELIDLGVERVVGIDIFDEARNATERDRPGVYRDYVVGDITDLSPQDRARLEEHDFNALVCVAALGFGDIPPEVFASALNLCRTGSVVSFNIKEDFIDDNDKSGFSGLIERTMKEGVLKIEMQKRYTHRLATDGTPLPYVAMVGTKERDIPDDWLN